MSGRSVLLRTFFKNHLAFSPKGALDLMQKISCVQPPVDISQLTPSDQQLFGKHVHDLRKKDKWLTLDGSTAGISNGAGGEYEGVRLS
jgi:hypothetical protein